MTTQEKLIRAIVQDVQDNADALLDAVDEYVDYVFAGNDPATLPSGDSLRWHDHVGVKKYAQQIVNAYRETRGLPPNPFPPTSSAYHLFDFLCAMI